MATLIGIVAIASTSCKKDLRVKHFIGDWSLTGLNYTDSYKETGELDFSDSDCGEDDTETYEEIMSILYNGSQATEEQEIDDDGDFDRFTYKYNYSYQLNVMEDGFYSVSGTYNYVDTENDVTYSGNFSSGDNKWYLDDDDRSNSKVTFENMPVVTVENILNGNIGNSGWTMTFDVDDFEKESMSLTWRSNFSDFDSSVSDFNIPLLNCDGTVTSKTTTIGSEDIKFEFSK